MTELAAPSTDLFHAIREGGQLPAEVNEQFPFYPLTAPGMPLPGEAFLREARALGDGDIELAGAGSKKRLTGHGVNLHYLYRRALYDENFTLSVTVRGNRKTAKFVPGHILGDTTVGMNGGPRSARVMIIGKNPGRDEVQEKANFVGPTAQIFFDALDELGVPESERFAWYVTNIVKWPALDEQSSTLPTAHKKDNAILLHQEIQLIRPDFILCLGSDASKFLLGTAYGVQAMVGRVQHYTIPVHDHGEDAQYHTAKVMAATHPAAVHRTPEMYPEFKDQIGLFISLIGGADVGGKERFINHRSIYKHRQLKQIVDEIIADPDPLRRIIAVDGEWEGELPANPGAYLRTVQFSTRHGEGINVVLRHQGGAPAFTPSIAAATGELTRLLKTDVDNNYYPRPGGHFLRADMPWLISEGIDIRDEYAPAATPELCRHQGGWDTGLQYHAVNETASYRLTDMTVRLTQAPVYDSTLKDHINDYCALHGIKKDALEGFGFLPAWILHPEPHDPEWGDNYAQYDADVTRRICIKHLKPGGMLDADWNQNPSWEPYWRSHTASLGVLEMEMAGITIDKDRVDQLTTLFMEVRQKLLDSFRANINWPNFNPGSPPQCVAFLFGDAYSAKRDKQTGARLGIRPEGAMTLQLQPIKSTGKRPRLWADLLSRGETNLYNPSTDKEVLGIIGHAHPLAMQLRDLKFINQVLTGPLRLPRMGEDGMTWERSTTGHLCYDKGLAAAAHADGKVHTHISQNKETGRGSSARPPLQNLSKRREGDYSRIMGTWETDKTTGARIPKGDYLHIFGEPVYQHPIRTIFQASPGHVLIEADYTGAELAVIAWMANDQNMIEHVRRNCLPEAHPDHYDIHSRTAVSAFSLPCAPTKKGLKDGGFKSLRVAAKNVNFGIPYGRSADAIARQCREEGSDVSNSDCQRMIDFYFVQYPSTREFLGNCRSRSQEERWLAGSFGRMRRFISSRDRGVIGDQERQAQNFPIQNTVADAVWTAIANFWAYRLQHPHLYYRMLLQIHDAILFEVPIAEVREFKEVVLPTCMVTNVPVWPRYLDNTPMILDAPYYFGIDTDVQINWGSDITTEQAVNIGLEQDLI